MDTSFLGKYIGSHANAIVFCILVGIVWVIMIIPIILGLVLRSPQVSIDKYKFVLHVVVCKIETLSKLVLLRRGNCVNKFWAFFPANLLHLFVG